MNLAFSVSLPSVDWGSKATLLPCNGGIKISESQVSLVDLDDKGLTDEVLDQVAQAIVARVKDSFTELEAKFELEINNPAQLDRIIARLTEKYIKPYEGDPNPPASLGKTKQAISDLEARNTELKKSLHQASTDN